MGGMDAKLKVIGGKANKGSISLKLPTVIGRSRKAGLTIAHPMISRRHCELYEADGLLMIRDLDSLNGTIIAERRVKESPLPPEAEFSIGPLTFRAEYKYAGDLSSLPEPVLSAPPAPSPDQKSWSDSPEPMSLDQATETVPPAEQAGVDFSFLDEIQGDQAESATTGENAAAGQAIPAESEEPFVAPAPPRLSANPAAKKKPQGLASMFKGSTKKKSRKSAKKPAPPPEENLPVDEDAPPASEPDSGSDPAPSQKPPKKPTDEDFDIDSFLDGLN